MAILQLLLLLGEIVLPDNVVYLLDVGLGEDVAAALLAHAPVVGCLGEAEVVIADDRTRCWCRLYFANC